MLCIFALLGVVAATQDLAIDAHYLASYKPEQQSRLMWLRNTSFRIAYLLGAGIFISLAGYISETKILNASKTGGWSIVFAISGVWMATSALSNKYTLDTVKSSVGYNQLANKPGLITAVKAMLALPAIWRIIIYTLVFRIGDAFLSAMAQPFMLDSANVGGLGLTTSTVGLIYGTFGALSLIAGGVIGGLSISLHGARKLLVPFSLLQSASILGYFFLAKNHPPVWIICAVNSFEQVCFGLTTSCYSIVLLTAVDPRFRATHFAFICAVMNLGLIFPSMISGLMADKLGYCNFFLLSFLLSMTGPLVSFMLPANKILDSNFKKQPRRMHD